ncbi:hypothetical protein Cgig2_026870 [Carnegiea gigantea]|uniref:Uncharacterized protein n=1 Tax=Carnegiea gigantea TaxID=171969 RepID=A0A9Q1KUB9_9CARY|nr:hypothetical protein Cgig2_026870 [Carnegiea gigantea]
MYGLFETQLDWGTDDPLQAAFIRTHLEDYELEEVAQVVFQMEGPHKIPHKVTFSKERGNRRFEMHDFLHAPAYYLCDETLFRHLAISLNFNLAVSELKQGKVASTMTICSLVLEFEPSNTKGLRNIHEALSDLNAVAKIEPYNSEIEEEIAKLESESYQVEDVRREFKGLENNLGTKRRTIVNMVSKLKTLK